MSDYRQVAEFSRQLLLERQREKQQSELEVQRQKIRTAAEVNVKRDRFTPQLIDHQAEQLKRETVGLVQLNDFTRLREEADRQKAAAEETKRQEQLDRIALGKRRKQQLQKSKLSFADDEEEEEEETAADRDPANTTNGSKLSQDGDCSGKHQQQSALNKKPKRLGKDPTVDTSFLPDREREEEEQRQREQLSKQWLDRQSDIKDQMIEVVHSFWDGSGHRASVTVRKGDTIGAFLAKAKLNFPQIRGVPTDNLLYVKEDVIIPHRYTFYEFIVSKARGKSGPLFEFTAYEDVRLVNDATKETTEAHAGKIVQRSWYEKNRHIFPANRWEVYDPMKDYGKYTFKDAI